VATDLHVALLEKGLHRVTLEHFQESSKGGLIFSWKRATDPGAPKSELLHDPAKLVPLSRKPSFEHYDYDTLPGAQEAETLPILQSAPVATFVLPFGRKKGGLVWGKNTKPDDRLKLRFHADRNVGTLGLAFWRSKNSGIVSVAVNGKILAPRVDLYSLSTHVIETEFKKVELLSGPNELEFVMVGSNPAAVEWKKGDGVHKMSLDYVRIR